MLQYYNIRPR